MRTIEEIKKEIADSFISNQTIVDKYELNPSLTFEEQFSKVSIESIIFYIVAVAIWSLESILNISIKQQNDYIKSIKIHSFTWYSIYAKKFQFGNPLPQLPYGEVEYDNTDLTEDEVEALQVVKYASVSKSPGGLMVKIAGVDNDELVPIDPTAFDAFKGYMFRISAAGDNLYFTNEVADDLKLKLKVFYDPLVLDSEGKRLDGSNDTPIQEAIDDYVKGMDFDGKFVPTYLIDALQEVEGVVIPHLIEAKTKYGVLAWMDVPPEGVNPFAGYVRINNPSDLDIEFVIA